MLLFGLKAQGVPRNEPATLSQDNIRIFTVNKLKSQGRKWVEKNAVFPAGTDRTAGRSLIDGSEFCRLCSFFSQVSCTECKHVAARLPWRTKLLIITPGPSGGRPANQQTTLTFGSVIDGFVEIGPYSLMYGEYDCSRGTLAEMVKAVN